MIKDFSTLVESFDIPTRFPDFEVNAGIYKDDECECFILEVVDLQYHQKKYVQSFNSEWCPVENKEWLACVLISGMIEVIKECRSFHKKLTKHAFDNFVEVLNS